MVGIPFWVVVGGMLVSVLFIAGLLAKLYRKAAP